ncbi:MAG: phosphoglycerate dehydrogenase [Flavobacteriales bacterium]|nr:phosphoglycerate dehydrogenase [Flavobacteriales bacterium]
MRIILVDSVHPLLAERLSAAGHEVIAGHHLADMELAKALGPVEGIVVRSRRLSADLMRHARSLQFVARVGSGLENVDRTYCRTKDIVVLNSPEGNRDGVGELCVAQTLALLKHLPRANRQVHEGLWLREENRGTDLCGMTVGIIGYGHMGSAFAEKLSGFGVRILAHDKYRSDFGTDRVEESTLDQLLALSRIISLHLPLSEDTRHYADAEFFNKLGQRAWFLNTSRGPITDTKALLDALDRGTIIGAALDVLEYERADLDGLDPAIDPTTQRRLYAHDRVLLTPHIAGVTHEGKLKMAAVLADKILAAFP